MHLLTQDAFSRSLFINIMPDFFQAVETSPIAAMAMEKAIAPTFPTSKIYAASFSLNIFQSKCRKGVIGLERF